MLFDSEIHHEIEIRVYCDEKMCKLNARSGKGQYSSYTM